jgi:hypothetical protein
LGQVQPRLAGRQKIGEKKIKMKNASLTTLLLAFMLALTTSAAWAANNNNNCGDSHNATWAPAGDSAITMPAGGSGDLGVNMTSPACLNNYPVFPGTLPVYTDEALDTAVCPDGTSGDDATCTLVAPVATITNNPQSYSDFSQTQTYNIHFDATNATPGTYSFHVHADASDPDGTHQNGDNLSGYGWGYGSGVELTVFVTTAYTCNPNDVLNVLFTAPQAGNVNYCNGGTTIPINVTAGDTNNKITSLSATVNSNPFGGLTVTGLNSSMATGTGNFTAGSVGAYTFVANATTACTTGSGSAVVNVVYVIPDLLPPLGSGGRPLHGSNVPIKFIPQDCTGNPVAFDNTVHIQVYNSTGTTLLQDSFAGGCTGSCGPGQSSWVVYNSLTGQYLAGFRVGNIPGTTYTVKIVFGGVVNFSTTFMTF